MLGAATRIRGGDDFSDVRIAGLITALRSELGPQFEVLYRRGKEMDRVEAIARLDPATLNQAP